MISFKTSFKSRVLNLFWFIQAICYISHLSDAFSRLNLFGSDIAYTFNSYQVCSYIKNRNLLNSECLNNVLRL